MSVDSKIDDGLIDSIILYKETAWYRRLDVFPFVLMYGNALAFILSDQTLLKIGGLVLFPIALSIHLLFFLGAQSSVNFRCLIGKQKVTAIADASYVMVKAAKNAGKDRIVKLIIDEEIKTDSDVDVLTKSYKLSKVTFSFQEVTYSYNSEQKKFQRLNYPIDVSVQECLAWRGHQTQDAFYAAIKRWGINEFNIPMPHFLDLYSVSNLNRYFPI
jgi:hypothetical protein